MKISVSRVAENRERVIAAALKLFRERGFAGVSVADLMRDAGLTHGGFYNHFASKGELEAQACLRAFAASARVLQDAAAAPPGPARRLSLTGYISRYLSRSWRDASGAPCPMVAFGADVAHGDSEVGKAFTAGVEAYVGALTTLLEDSGDHGAARRRAIVLTASLTGAMTLARSVRASSPALSDEILAAVRDDLLNALTDD